MIINAPCQDILASVSSDAVVVTDPPYNIGFKYDTYTDVLPDDEYIELLAEMQRFRKIAIIQYPEETMRLVVPALGPPDAVVAWCYNANIRRRFRLISFYGGTPDYTRLRQPYKNPTDKRVRHLIENGSEGSELYEWWTDIQLVKNVSTEKTIHPCPIPQALAERIITLFTEPNDVVFDPFAGVGTTLVAARNLGRHYIGCEISENYYYEALRKLNPFGQ